MCVTLAPAKLSKTIIYAGEGHHPDRRDIHSLTYMHVLGYQNNAENKSGKPNAMILPIPSKGELGPENIIDTTSHPGVLSDMASAIEGMNRDQMLGISSKGFPSIKVFSAGSYTVALAPNASQLIHAIAALPEALRPIINREIVQAYSEWYADWPIAVCAWDGRIEAEPLLWWYEPIEPKVLFLPALDSHNGKVPNLKRDVQRDHTLLIGSNISPFGLASHLDLDNDDPLRGFLPPQVWGQVVKGSDFNGDYTVEVEPLRQLKNYQGRHDLHERLDPKIWDIEFENYNPASH